MMGLVYSDVQFELVLSAVVGKVLYNSRKQEIENHGLQVPSGPLPVSLQPVN